MAKIGTVDFSHMLKKLDKITDDLKKEMAAALYIGGLKIDENAKNSIQRETKTGRTYNRGTVAHRASAEGQAPANDTARLVGSFAVSQSANKLAVRIKSGGQSKNGKIVKYAVDLEFGTKNMGARPFMKPALEKSRAFIEARMKAGIKKGVAKNAK